MKQQSVSYLFRIEHINYVTEQKQSQEPLRFIMTDFFFLNITPGILIIREIGINLIDLYRIKESCVMYFMMLIMLS